MHDLLIQGDEATWSAWYPYIEPSIRAEIQAVVRRELPEYSIDDIVQDVFRKLIDNNYAALRSFDPAKANLRTYVKSIAKNEAIDRSIKAARQRKHETPVGLSTELAAIEEMNHVRQRV